MHCLALVHERSEGEERGKKEADIRVFALWRNTETEVKKKWVNNIWSMKGGKEVKVKNEKKVKDEYKLVL